MFKILTINLLHYLFIFRGDYRGRQIFGSWLKQCNSNDLDVVYVFDNSKPLAASFIRYALGKFNIDVFFVTKNSDGRYIFQYRSKEDIVFLELRKDFEVGLAQ